MSLFYLRYTTKCVINRKQYIFFVPIMVNFWDNILFYTGNYRGQPMNLHHHLHQLSNLTLEHFARWNKLFDSTVDALFEGENAERAKQNAHSISTVMQLKILNKHKPL